MPRDTPKKQYAGQIGETIGLGFTGGPMAKVLGGDGREMYQHKGSSNLLASLFVSWRGRAAVVSVDRETAKQGFDSLARLFVKITLRLTRAATCDIQKRKRFT